MTVDELKKLDLTNDWRMPGKFIECCYEINDDEKPETNELYMTAKKIEDGFIISLLRKLYDAHHIFGFKDFKNLEVEVADESGTGYVYNKVEIHSIEIDKNDIERYVIYGKDKAVIPFSYIRPVGVVSMELVARIKSLYDLMDTLVTDGEILTD